MRPPLTTITLLVASALASAQEPASEQAPASSDLTRLLAELDHPDNRRKIQALRSIQLLGTRAREALPDLFYLFSDREPMIRDAAVNAAAAVGQDDAKALGDLLLTGEPAQRGPALAVLSRLGARAAPALPALRTALDDPALRPGAAAAIVAVGLAAAPAILEEFREGGAGEAALLAALPGGNKGSLVGPLMSALGDPAETAIYESLEQALLGFLHAEALSVFAELREPGRRRREAAAGLLRKHAAGLGWQFRQQLRMPDEDIARELIAIIPAMGDAARDLLPDMLRYAGSQDAGLRRNLLAAQIELGHAGTAAASSDGLKDPDPQVRSVAEIGEALTAPDRAAAWTRLLAILRAADDPRRPLILRGARHTLAGDRRNARATVEEAVLPDILAIAAGPRGPLRDDALRLLTAAPPLPAQAAPVFIAVLRDARSDAAVRVLAADTLVASPEGDALRPDVLDALLDAAADRGPGGHAAATALLRWNPTESDTRALLLKLHTGSTPGARAAAAGLLARAPGDPARLAGSLREARAGEEDAAVREAIERALRALQ